MVEPLVLSGNKLEDFLPLSSAEKKLRQSAASGSVCMLGSNSAERPSTANANNRVRGNFLTYLIKGGCEQTPVTNMGLHLIGAYVECKGTDCFDLEAVNVAHTVVLERCTIAGTVRLVRASVMEFNLTGSQVHGVDAEGMACGSNFRLDHDFVSEGTIRLRNAKILGNLICQQGKFLDGNNAIIANRARIDGDVDLGKIEASGTIALTGALIGGDFMPQGAVLRGTPALQLRNSGIGGTLHWRGLGFVDGEVDLSGATCETLNTGNTSWLRKRDKYRDLANLDNGGSEDESESGRSTHEYHTKLDNFTYGSFTNLPDNIRSSYWIEWLNQQPDDHLGARFKPRPWDQLASVLDSMGLEEEARDVRVEKQKILTRFMWSHETPEFSVTFLWHLLRIFFRRFLWGPVVAYGYRPGNALLFLFAFIVLGTIIYHQAALRGVMTPTHPLIYKEAREQGSIPAWCAENWVYFPDETCAAAMPSEYSEFQSFIYAADVALPVVNLRMEDDWAPRVVFTDGTRHSFGWSVRLFEWLLIGIGWILSLLFVSAVGSSIRR